MAGLAYHSFCTQLTILNTKRLKAMSLAERVKRAVEENEPDPKSERALREADRFQEEMVRAGVLVKREYDIAPPDTIGRKAHEASIAHREQRSFLA